uniref:Uncharacterized protein n=1 Tax=Arion vulgaris TaxID=1028688 RepID=A0A0B6Y7U8_9EUPU
MPSSGISKKTLEPTHHKIINRKYTYLESKEETPWSRSDIENKNTNLYFLWDQNSECNITRSPYSTTNMSIHCNIMLNW